MVTFIIRIMGGGLAMVFKGDYFYGENRKTLGFVLVLSINEMWSSGQCCDSVD